MALQNWALPRLTHLLPLDEESLKQIISYTDSLSKPAAAEHLKNLLGDSPAAFEFISSFNTRRAPPIESIAQASSTVITAPSSRDVSESEVPKRAPRPQKKKKDFNKLPPVRKPEDYGNLTGGYVKKDEDDYMTGRSSRIHEPILADNLALQSHPDAIQLPIPVSTISRPQTPKQTSKLPPSAAGTLISDAIPSRSASPSKATSAKAKISLTGGTSMRGASTALQDLDSAIRSLEIQTNPTLGAYTSADNARRRCDCMAQRHALLAAAPNCLNCGKIVCAKEGLGPCTFCERPLLSSDEIQAMVRVLKEERGKERMDLNNAVHKKAEIAKAPRPFSTPSGVHTPVSSEAPSSDSESDRSRSLIAAKQHRDRLLKFQAENARRTRIHDEAADFETPDSGTSMWASPQERALQLKRQQKTLREQEWNAKADWEKKKVVVSIDISSGKAVRRMETVNRPIEVEEDDADDEVYEKHPTTNSGKGTFAKNPLLGGLIRPTYKVKEDVGTGKGKAPESRKNIWRRVQDDNEDNEQWILDGGAYGGKTENRALGAEERAVGY